MTLHRSPAIVPALLLTLATLACGDDPTGPDPQELPSAIAMGQAHGCRLEESGRALCWGSDAGGQLGRGAETGVEAGAVPAPVAGDHRFIDIAGGRVHACGLTAEGAVHCWGENGDGQLGVATDPTEVCGVRACSRTPLPAAAGFTFAALEAGGQVTCGLRADGAAFCWGRNDLGQLGADDAPDDCGVYACSRRPVRVGGAMEFAVLSVGSLDHSCGLTRDGRAYCWGSNIAGQLGDGTGGRDGRRESRAQPMPVVTDVRFRTISASGLHTCALTDEGRAWCWGIDALGAGPTLLESSLAVPVAGDLRFERIVSGRVTTCALTLDGMAYCWGPNSSGEVGVEPVGAHVRFDVPTPVSGGHTFVDLSGDTSTYCATDAAGTTWCWGEGEDGELGDPAIAESTEPVQVVRWSGGQVVSGGITDHLTT